MNNSCTSHIAKDLQLFSNIDKSRQTRVILGHEETIFAKEKGTVEMRSQQELKHISNVFSVSRFCKICLAFHKFYTIVLCNFKSPVCTIFDLMGGEIVKDDKLENSFYLNGDSINHHVLSTRTIYSYT